MTSAASIAGSGNRGIASGTNTRSATTPQKMTPSTKKPPAGTPAGGRIRGAWSSMRGPRGSASRELLGRHRGDPEQRRLGDRARERPTRREHLLEHVRLLGVDLAHRVRETARIRGRLRARGQAVPLLLGLRLELLRKLLTLLGRQPRHRLLGRLDVLVLRELARDLAVGLVDLLVRHVVVPALLEAADETAQLAEPAALAAEESSEVVHSMPPCRWHRASAAPRAGRVRRTGGGVAIVSRRTHPILAVR